MMMHGLLKVLLAVVVYLLIEITIVRVYYMYRINHEIKNIALTFGKKYPQYTDVHFNEGMAMNKNTQEHQTCSLAKELSSLRQDILKDTRSLGVITKMTSEAFDSQRGVSQPLKVQALLKKKSCENIIHSSYKSNESVNYTTMTVAVVLLIISVIKIVR